MNANEIKNMIIGIAAAVGSAITEELGGWDMALKVLVGFMVADLLTGWLVAAIWKKSAKSANGCLDSKASYKGIVKKCVMLLLVWMGTMLDRVTGSNFIRTAVCYFFIANEGLSILENTAIMGVPYPRFVKEMLEVMKDRTDNGEEQVKQDE